VFCISIKVWNDECFEIWSSHMLLNKNVTEKDDHKDDIENNDEDTNDNNKNNENNNDEILTFFIYIIQYHIPITRKWFNIVIVIKLILIMLIKL